MNKISSFTINHLELLPGIYVSRKDNIKENTITTFDIRMVRPNFEPVMGTSAIHTIEHLGATYLRNDKIYSSKTIYFGPMGCRTGFYLLLSGDYCSKDIFELLINMFKWILEFEGDIPGSSAKDCGNYLDMNLSMAKYYSNKYLSEVLLNIDECNLNYPE